VIRIYTVVDKVLSVNEISSQDDMDKLTSRFRRAWVDCWDLDDKEIRIVSGILGVKPEDLKKTKEQDTNPKYTKCFDDECLFYTNISTPVVEFSERLVLHHFRIFLKKRFLVTLRSRYSSRIIDSTIRTFQTLDPQNRKPSVILAKLIHEIIDENSGAMVSIRELIDKIEGQAMKNPKKKTVTKTIFRLKRQLSTFYRLLWAEKELLTDMRLGVIPNLKLVSEAKRIIDDASDDIEKELEFIGYYDNSLDSVLNLLNLGSIHGIEKVLVILTVALVGMTIVLIILEVTSQLLH
jgi:Mg2+ and Co2+ transporter CorA